jgi:histone deacetylase 11
MVPIVYSPLYNITACGLERLHPFDSRKYRRIHDRLIHQGSRRPGDFMRPEPCTRADLLHVHTPEYLDSLRRPRVLASILEVPVVRFLPGWFTRWRVLRPMRWAAGGTVLACRLAQAHGLAVNLGGGYHHAGPDQGGGFCAYADVPLALTLLKKEGQIGTALVVDTDAHQGNGTADAVRPWGWVHTLDLYEEDNYPWPKVAEDMAVPLPPGLGGAAYLDILRTHLARALDRFRPEFVVYNAGSDVLANDPLSHLQLSIENLTARDLLVVTEVRGRGVPLAMVLSGGYGSLSWKAHARSIERIVARFDSPRM